MLGAIHLDDQLSLWSIEVHDVVADRLLSVKLDRLELPAAQPCPQRTLTIGHLPTEAAGRSFSLRLYSITAREIPLTPLSKGGTEPASQPCFHKLLNRVWSEGTTAAGIILRVTYDYCADLVRTGIISPAAACI